MSVSTGDPFGQEAGPTATKPPEAPGEDNRWRGVMHDIVSGNAIVAVLSVVLAVAVGSLLIAFTDEHVRDTASYIFARPGDFFSASWDAIWGAYTALFRGSIYNTRAQDFQTAIRPLTETCKFAAPLHACSHVACACERRVSHR